jgi:hypothetical protein
MIDFKDTPNPNAKKIDIQHNYEISIYLDIKSVSGDKKLTTLIQNPGIKSIFTGPGFLTILKEDNADWIKIIKDLDTNTDSI